MYHYYTKRLWEKAAAVSLALCVAGAGALPVITALPQTAVVAEAASQLSVKLNVPGVTLGKGETYQLKASVSGTGSAGKTVAWSSSDKNTAVVSSKGLVTAKRTGIVTITASVGSVKAQCSITIKAQPDTVAVSKQNLSLGVGETYTLSAVLPNGTASEKKSFRSSSSTILNMLVSERIGQIRAAKEGNAKVTLYIFNGRQASCNVSVRKAPQSISISKKTLELYVGQSYTLSSSVPNGTASAKRTYRSSDPKIIGMLRTDWAGQFRAVKPGVAWVTVRSYNGKESSCKIRVKEKPKYSNKIQNYNNKVYYTPYFVHEGISGNISMTALGGNYTALPKPGGRDDLQIDSFVIYKDKIYFRDQNVGTGAEYYPSRLYVCDLNGKNLKKLASNAKPSFMFDDGKLIYNLFGSDSSYSYDPSTGKTAKLSGAAKNIPLYDIFRWDNRWGVTGGSTFNSYIFYREFVSKTGNNIYYYAKNKNTGKITRIGSGYTPQR